MKLGDLIKPEQHAVEVLDMFLHKQCDLERTKFAYDANTVFEAVRMARNALEKQNNVLERLEELMEKAMSNSEKAAELGKAYEKHMIFNGAKGTAFEEAIDIVKEELGIGYDKELE